MMETVSTNEAMLSDYAERIVELVLSSNVRLPASLPRSGKIVSVNNALAFLKRHAQMLARCGPQLSMPRIAFHWTAEANLQSIAETNLRVPDGANLKRKNGAAFGHGIYLAPRFRDFREDFSNGASVAVMALVITGRQQVRRPRSEARGVLELPDDFDSVRGFVSNRPCETWVLPEADLVLPCFLVDELALQEATEVLQAVIHLISASAEAEGSSGHHQSSAEQAPHDSCSFRRWGRGKLIMNTCPEQSAENAAQSQESTLQRNLGQADEKTPQRDHEETAADIKTQLHGVAHRRRWQARTEKLR
mmetsp:Transcript_6210/g.11280  ORF Transcript_6210/g.11280 Transcript_6210/m.11280 type:complete len:305 (-) Transcript_6210:124-1038(-)